MGAYVLPLVLPDVADVLLGVPAFGHVEFRLHSVEVLLHEVLARVTEGGERSGRGHRGPAGVRLTGEASERHIRDEFYRHYFPELDRLPRRVD